jgi:hypothetical protein
VDFGTLFGGSGTGTTAIGGVTFTGNPDLLVVDEGYFPPFYATGSASGGGGLSVQYPGPVSLDIALPGSFTAIGFDTNATFGNDLVNVSLSNGETVSYTLSDISGQFFGLTTISPFTSLSLSTDNNVLNVDDFTYGSSKATPSPVVPEPSSLALFLPGLAAFGVMRRRSNLRVARFQQGGLT